MRLVLFLLTAAFAMAQDTAPPPMEMNAAEKQFQESLNNVTLIGFFTQGDTAELHDDKYVIERVTKGQRRHLEIRGADSVQQRRISKSRCRCR